MRSRRLGALTNKNTMTLEQVRQMIESENFSPEIHAVMRSILEGATARGSLTEEEKTKLLGLIDLEVEVAHTEADAMEEMASALDEFAGEVDGALEATATDLQAADTALAAALKT